ncbi:MAG: cytochrome c [Bacteroidota bacterium]
MKSQLLNSNIVLHRLILLLLFLCLILLVSTGCNNSTEQTNDEVEEINTEEIAKSSVEEGKEWYTSYCTMCHGKDGSGDGILIDKLQQIPPDLRTLSLRGGEFSRDLISNIIAGVENVPGHSTGDMPAWFETFKESEGITDEAVLREKINRIVDYLETIQLEDWPAE